MDAPQDASTAKPTTPARPNDLTAERVCAEAEGGIVLFLIGMRINRFWKVWNWFPVVRAMTRMLNELAAHPELGLLSTRGSFGLRNLSATQYWQSAEHLRAFAQASNNTHLPAWQAFNRRAATSGSDVGIWHETYIVPAANLESIYVNMPPHGLSAFGKIFPAKGPRASAAKRLANATGVPPQTHADPTAA